MSIGDYSFNSRIPVLPAISSAVLDEGRIRERATIVEWMLQAFLYPNRISSVVCWDQTDVVRSARILQDGSWQIARLGGDCENLFGGQFVESIWSKSNVKIREVLANLQDIYSFENSTEVGKFIEENSLLGILTQASEPINRAFGTAPAKKLTLVEDDEGVRTLFCLVMISGDMHQAREALKAFDYEWWFQQSRKLSGKLNFDFELI